MNEEVSLLTKRSALDDDDLQHIFPRIVKEEEVEEYMVIFRFP